MAESEGRRAEGGRRTSGSSVAAGPRSGSRRSRCPRRRTARCACGSRVCRRPGSARGARRSCGRAAPRCRACRRSWRSPERAIRSGREVRLDALAGHAQPVDLRVQPAQLFRVVEADRSDAFFGETSSEVLEGVAVGNHVATSQQREERDGAIPRIAHDRELPRDAIVLGGDGADLDELVIGLVAEGGEARLGELEADGAERLELAAARRGQALEHAGARGPGNPQEDGGRPFGVGAAMGDALESERRHDLANLPRHRLPTHRVPPHALEAARPTRPRGTAALDRAEWPRAR